MPSADPRRDQAEAEAEALAKQQQADARRNQVVASTFANVELQSTKNTLAQYVNLYNGAKAELAKLTQEIQERDKDAMTVVQFLRDDLEGRQEQIKELKATAEHDLRTQREAFEAERIRLLDQVRERDERVSELQQSIGNLQANLEALEAYRRAREELHAELSRLRDEHRQTIEKYEGELSKLRFQSLEEKIRLKAEERTLQTRFAEEVNSRAMRLLDPKSKEIRQENFLLLQDKSLLEQELQRASEAQARVNANAAETQREVDLAKLADDQHVRRAVEKGREVRELRARCSEMEGNVTTLVQNHQAEIDRLSAAQQAEVQRLTTERDDALRTAQLIQRDFLKMRQLTRNVVRQRTDLETFFLEALDYVRGEIERDQRGGGSRVALLPGQSSQLAAITVGPNVPSSNASAVSDGTGPNPSSTLQRGAAARAARRAEKDAAVEAVRMHKNLQVQEPSKWAPTQTTYSRHRVGKSAPAGGAGGSDVPTLPQIGQRRGPPVSTTAPATTAPPRPAGTSATPSDDDPQLHTGVDVSQLSWLEKERVLRILFAKINGGGGGAAATRGLATESVLTGPKSIQTGKGASDPSTGVLPPPRAIEAPKDTVFVTQS